MKVLTRSLAIAALLCAFFGSAAAQSTAITATRLNMAGSPISSGRVTLLPVDANGKAIEVVSGGALNGPQAFSCSIASGAISGSCSVPDACLATPANFLYTIQVTDTSLRNPTSGQSFAMTKIVGVCGSSWALDAYAPPATTTNVQPIQISSGTAVPTSACVTPSEYHRLGTSSTIYICNAGSWVLVTGSGGGTSYTFPTGVLAGANSTAAPTAATSLQMQAAIGSGVYDAAGAATAAVAGSIGPVIKVTDPAYGAVGDNSTDNSTAFAAVATAANASSVVPTIYFPIGTYKYASGLAFNRQVQMKCEPGTWLNYTGTGTAVQLGSLSWTMATTSDDKGGIDSCGFMGGASMTKGILVVNNNLGPTNLTNNRFLNFGNTTAYAMWYDGENVGFIDHNYYWSTDSVKRNILRENNAQSTFDSELIITNNWLGCATGIGVDPNAADCGVGLYLDGVNQVKNNDLYGGVPMIQLGPFSARTEISGNTFELGDNFNGVSTGGPFIQYGRSGHSDVLYDIHVHGNHGFLANSASFISPGSATAKMVDWTVADNSIFTVADGNPNTGAPNTPSTSPMIVQNDLTGQRGNIATNNKGFASFRATGLMNAEPLLSQELNMQSVFTVSSLPTTAIAQQQVVVKDLPANPTDCSTGGGLVLGQCLYLNGAWRLMSVGGTVGIPIQLQDTFGGTAGTALTSHTANTGQSWTYGPAFIGIAGPLTLSGSNTITSSLANSNFPTAYSSLTPTSADYTVTGVFNLLAGSNQVAAVHGRVDVSGQNAYSCYYNLGNTVTMYKWNAGTATSLGAATVTPWSISSTHSLALGMSGTTLTCSADGSVLLTRTDATVTATGTAAIEIQAQNFSASSVTVQ